MGKFLEHERVLLIVDDRYLGGYEDGQKMLGREFFYFVDIFYFRKFLAKQHDEKRYNNNIVSYQVQYQ